MTAVSPLFVVASSAEVGRFFDPGFIQSTSERAGVTAEIQSLLNSSAERFRQNPQLQERFWHYHDALFRKPEHSEHYLLIAEAEKELGDPSNMLQALLFLSAVPLVIQAHKRRGISEMVTRDTLSDLMIKFHEHKAAKGQWGMPNLGWLYRHARGRLFQIGRLQYIPDTFRGKLTAYRHRVTGRVVALAHEGIRFRRDGQMDGTSNIFDAQSWTSSLRETADGMSGNPIHPNGRALQQEVKLPSAEWRRVLDGTMSVLDIHIPGGSAMAFDACGESLKGAIDFFARYFPEKRFVGFECMSWMLDNQLPEILPEESNLSRFAREFYLYPSAEASDRQAFERVFGGVMPDLTKVPSGTSLQRAMLRHLREGKHFHHGGAFLLLEDMKWGHQPYRGMVLE